MSSLLAASAATSSASLKLSPHDALVIVDMQRDFMPGGALPVPAGSEIVRIANRYIDLFVKASLPVFATRDWHPADHCSFREHGGPWSAHCIAESPGAAFADGLELPAWARVISKATKPDREAYSDFENTDFDTQLKQLQIKRLFIGGVATEYCVKATVHDALEHGYGVLLLLDAIRPLDVHRGDGDRAIDSMLERGVKGLTWDELCRAMSV